jgi:hypothetical protein
MEVVSRWSVRTGCDILSAPHRAPLEGTHHQDVHNCEPLGLLMIALPQRSLGWTMPVCCVKEDNVPIDRPTSSVQDKLVILSLALAIVTCGVPASAAELMAAPTHNTQPTAVYASLMQLGSQLYNTSLDCSHLVHALYERAGLNYPYTTSRTFYRGIKEFQRVQSPTTGDLVVWRGHMGIVIDPSQHRFLSALRTGVQTSSYISEYWKRWGPPRFFRYALSAKYTTPTGQY